MLHLSVLNNKDPNTRLLHPWTHIHYEIFQEWIVAKIGHAPPYGYLGDVLEVQQVKGYVAFRKSSLAFLKSVTIKAFLTYVHFGRFFNLLRSSSH